MAGNIVPVHVMGASLDGPPIPLRRRYLRIPMGHWPYRPGCPCPKCPKVLDERSEVGWCIMCGSFGCSWCCSVVEYRILDLRTSAERAIGANWNCATWELLLRGRPCAPGSRKRAVNVCSDASCVNKFIRAKKCIGEHGIELRMSLFKSFVQSP